MSASHEQKPGLFQARIIAAYITGTPLILMIALSVILKKGIFVPPKVSGIPQPLLTGVLAVAGLGAIIGSYFLHKRFRSMFQGNESSFTRLVQGIVLPMSSAEAGAIIGMIHTLLNGSLLLMGVLGGLAFAVCIFYFPSPQDFNETETNENKEE